MRESGDVVLKKLLLYKMQLFMRKIVLTALLIVLILPFEVYSHARATTASMQIERLQGLPALMQ